MTDLSARMVNAYLAGDLPGACLYGEAAGGDESTDVNLLRALARMHLEGGNLDRGIALFERAAELQPGIPSKMDVAYAHLYAGHDQGWDLHEARIPRNLARVAFQPKRPRWRGQRVNRLLVLPEGGYGDLIQFARFLPMAAELCSSVVFKIPRGLERLFAHAQLGVEIDASKGHFPAHDAWCFAMSLPFMLGLGFSDIKGDSYLRSAATHGAGRRPAVGLAWGGSPLHPRDNQRSLPAEHLANLLSHEGVDWVSLQIGPHANDLSRIGARLTDCPANDFLETAEIIAGLDLVVTVDTCIAHLAGALGKPTLVMLSTMPDFRYPGYGGTTLWYNSLKLVRQEKPGDWAPVVERIRTTLDEGIHLAKFINPPENDLPCP